MNKLGHRLRIACAAILSALAFAQSSGAEPPVAPPAGGLVRVSRKLRAALAVVYPAENLVLKSISILGKEPIVLLSVKPPTPNPSPTAMEVGLQNGYWFTAGDSAFGYTVKAIAKDHVILVPRSAFPEIKITRDSAPVAAIEAKPYSRAWINSRANPMLLDIQSMPGRMDAGAWDGLTRKQQAQVLEFYRKHGWKLIPSKTDVGPTQLDWQNLYEAERAAAIEANKDNFARTLNPEQQALWQQVRGFGRVYYSGGPTDEQRKSIAARRRLIDEFKQSLTPEQNAEHASLQDFTKARWK